MKQTGLLFAPAFDWAISPTHPEREERLLYTRDQLFEEGIMDLPQIKEYQPRLAQLKDIARLHICVPDVESQITDAHLVACGGALVIADAVMNQEIKNGFSLARPPGHHSMTVAHGNRGFCNINNEAIMVEYLRKKYGLRRIAIVDTDVHHGDGTQEIFYNDPDVLFISFHQDGRTLYPGTGFADELGGPLAFGTTINVPLSPRTTDQGIHYVLDNLILPVLDEFKPELVINSAGQDNHYSDPLANMHFTARGYAELNRKLAPDIAVLEGGYSVETALPYINMGIIMAMAGLDYSNLQEPDYHRQVFKEQEKNMEYIKILTEDLLQVFRNRAEVVASNRESLEEYYRTHKQIFYDTDNISEQQTSQLRVCPDGCYSYRIITSQAQHGSGRKYRIMAYSIPLYCCSKCREEALELFWESKKKEKNYDLLYLQDKPEDCYVSYNCRQGEERVLE